MNLMKKYGAIEYARRTAERLTGRAKASLNGLSRNFKDDEAKATLFALVDFMVRRDW